MTLGRRDKIEISIRLESLLNLVRMMIRPDQVQPDRANFTITETNRIITRLIGVGNSGLDRIRRRRTLLRRTRGTAADDDGQGEAGDCSQNYTRVQEN